MNGGTNQDSFFKLNFPPCVNKHARGCLSFSQILLKGYSLIYKSQRILLTYLERESKLLECLQEGQENHWFHYEGTISHTENM